MPVQGLAIRIAGLFGVGRDNPELDLGVDVLAEVELDRVEAQVLERAFDPDVLGLDREALGLEGLGDLVGVDRAVEVAFLVGVGLDGKRPLGDLRGQSLQVGPACFLELRSRSRCFSTIRRLCGVAKVASPWGSR